MKTLLKTVIIDNVTYEIYGSSNDRVNKFDEIKNLISELERLWEFLDSVEKTLNNKSFIEKANKVIVEKEIKKFNDTIDKMLSIENILYNYLILN
jgi:valyl-tRNA synthetase